MSQPGFRYRRTGAVVLLLASLTMPGLVHAQAAREADASARLQRAVQQLTAERAELQAENAKLGREVKELEDKVASLTKETESLGANLRRAEGKASQTEANNEALQRNYDLTRERLDEVVARYRELAEELRVTETERANFKATLENRNQQLKSCRSDNVQLAGIANEALDRYENKGCFNSLAQAEPFTGLARAQIENTIDSYRDQIEDLRVNADSPPGE